MKMKYTNYAGLLKYFNLLLSKRVTVLMMKHCRVAKKVVSVIILPLRREIR